MNQDQTKAEAFISRLLSNPALQVLSPLQREEQIVQFLKQNAGKLMATLTSPQFFPDNTWEQVLTLLYRTLTQETDKQLYPRINRLISDDLDLAYVLKIKAQNLSTDEIKQSVAKLLPEMLAHAEARQDFGGVYNAMAFSLFEKYIDAIFDRRQYAFIEVSRRQSLSFSKEEIKNFIKTALFLRPAIYLLAPEGSLLRNEQAAGAVQSQYVDKVFAAVQRRVPSLPEDVIRTALSSHESFLDDPSLLATARICSIIALMWRSYQPNMKVDRGADTHDKSWLNIARRNYKYYGFDIKMLDEFFKIAADNGW